MSASPTTLASSSTSTLLPSKRKYTQLDPAMTPPLSNAANTLLSQFHLPPLPDLGVPPLPEIRDKELERQAYTHSSHVKKSRNATSLEVLERIEDNEKLEHVGDAILNSTVTLLLHRLFPYLQVGGATLVKGHLVSNTSLSQLSKHYKLPDRLIAAPSEVWNLRAGEKVQANMFEAYIAALYLSYLSHDKALAGKSSSSTSVGLPSPPATPLTSSSSSPETLVSPNADAAGRAFALVGTWLNPLFTPLAHWVLDELRIEQKRLEEKHTGSNEDAEMDTRATGAMARLNEHLIRFHKKIPEYLAHRETSDQWTVMCNAEDKDGKVFSASATRGSKKGASTVAAYKVCLEMGL